MLRECVNIKVASWIANELSFKEFFAKSNCKSQKEAKEEYSKTISYCAEMLKNDGEMMAKYAHTNNRIDGRRFGKKNIQGVMRYVRGMLLEGITTDIDMVNCHPFILLNLCLEHNIECAYLKQYINEREECLAQIMEYDQLNREDAKKKVLVSTNMEKKINTKSAFLKNYDKEMKKVQADLQEVEQYKYIAQYAKKDNNFNGSFVNHLLCVKEDQLLKAMEEFCNMEADLEVHSLAFDGLQVYGDHYEEEELLKDMEQFIVRKGLYPVKLTYKEHSIGWEIPEDYVPHQTQYGVMKEEFEKHNCKVGCQFVNEHDGEITIYSLKDFSILHMEKKVVKNGKKVNFIDEWFEDTGKRMYDRFGCHPKNCPNNEYNMWIPFKALTHTYTEDRTLENLSFKRTFESVEEKCEAGFMWFCNHLMNIICDGNEPAYKFFLLWLSQMIQYPENKSIEIIVCSKPGAGKDLLLSFIKQMIGKEPKTWECADPQKEVFGDFNDQMKDAFLVVMPESDKSCFYNCTSKKKQIITNPTININIKNVKKFTMPSYHRFLEFSNHFNLQPLERRNMVYRANDMMRIDDERDSLEVKDKKQSYYDEGFAYAQDPDVGKYIFEMMSKMPTKQHITRRDIPKTEFHLELEEANKAWWLLWLEDLIAKNISNGVTTRSYQNDTLSALFSKFCSENRYQENMGTQSLLQCVINHMKVGQEPVGITKARVRESGEQLYKRGWTLDFLAMQKHLNLEVCIKGDCKEGKKMEYYDWD